MSLQPHIQLSKEMTGARYALLPGDPQRVDRIANFLDNPQPLGQNREFRAARGWYQGVEILVLSTGIGGPSTAIAIEELRQIGVTTLIRIGSCGALQDNLALGDVIIAHAALMTIGALRGLRTASLLNVVVAHNGCLDSSINDYVQQEALCQQGEERQITLALRAIYSASQQGGL